MKNEMFDRDKDYWNEYYSLDKGEHAPSLFAEFIWDTYIKDCIGNLLELGCGNGRDSEFFMSLGVPITAIDAADTAISYLVKKHKNDENATFICGDFVDAHTDNKYKYCYSRFTIHAITEMQEEKLIKRISKLLDNDGYFFIEVRSIHDELYGCGEKVGENAYIFDGHYRRFVCMGELATKLEKEGFIIDYAAEQRGFAPHGTENPYIIRIVGKKC